jgi:hypothetical protein
MELPFLTVNYDPVTTVTQHYTTLNQRYEYEQCYHPTEREIKKSHYFLTYPHKLTLLARKVLRRIFGPKTGEVTG